jgi:hypothetical protein
MRAFRPQEPIIIVPVGIIGGRIRNRSHCGEREFDLLSNNKVLHFCLHAQFSAAQGRLAMFHIRL